LRTCNSASFSAVTVFKATVFSRSPIFEFRFELLDMNLFCGSRNLRFSGQLRLSQHNSGQLFQLSQQETFMKLLVKPTIENLLEDFGITILVDLECFLGIGVFEFMRI